MDTIRRLESLRRREHESTVALIEALVECLRREDHVAAGGGAYAGTASPEFRSGSEFDCRFGIDEADAARAGRGISRGRGTRWRSVHVRGGGRDAVFSDP